MIPILLLAKYLHCPMVQTAEVHVLKAEIGPLGKIQQTSGKVLKGTGGKTLQAGLTGADCPAEQLAPSARVQMGSISIDQTGENVFR